MGIGTSGGWGPGASWLDVKLAVRMARRQPGLTAVAVFALALGIPASLIPSQLAHAFSATLPFDEGERIVGVQNRNLEEVAPEAASLQDFELWRDALGSFQRLGAFRSDAYNVISEDGRAAPVRGAEVTASAFDIVRVEPLLGRRLVVADEAPGAPDVVVLGYEIWRSRLAGDPDVVGRTIRIGRTPHEVIGVMPEGFLFPTNDHLWLPLRERAVDHAPYEGPRVRVFGRLADGVALESADLEARTVGGRVAAERPASHGHLRTEVVPYPHLGTDIDFDDPAFVLVQLVALVLLVVACGNVGILILARTATRTSEIAVRTALGAGRGRIVSQLFVETLVTAVVAAGVGLAVGDALANRFQSVLAADNDLPFWLDFGVQPQTVGWAMALAVLSAVIAGMVPALKATGRDIQRSLQRATAGTSGIRFGVLSSALIVAEVAVTVWFLTIAGTMAPQMLVPAGLGMGIDPSEFLVAELRLPWPDPPAGDEAEHRVEFERRLAETQRELARRLSAEPGVTGVAFADRLPGEDHFDQWIEVEGAGGVPTDTGTDGGSDAPGSGGGGAPGGDGAPAGPGLHWVRTARVDVDFFRELGRPILAGRDFDRGDVTGVSVADRRAVIVNETLVEQALGGRNAIGRRIRVVLRGGTEPGPWYEIVGVVGHLGMYDVAPHRDAGFYFPVAPGELHPVRVAVGTSDPAAFGPRLREIAAAVDPDAMIGSPRPLDRVVSEDRMAARWGTLVFGLIATIAIVLSTAGLYALVSFTVSERTREIGLRTALGALPGSVAATVGRRAVLQLAGGVVLGAAVASWQVPQMFSGPAMQHIDWRVLVGITAGLTLLVGLLSCIPPTLRGLRISPMEALKEG